MFRLQVLAFALTMWQAWAREHRVAFPERFNMYEFLRKKEAKPTTKSGE